MIFSGVRFHQVLQGTKTQTRRPYKIGQILFEGEVRQWVPNIFNPRTSRKIWKIGQTYAVSPGRGKFGQAYIKLTGIRRELLGEITHEDAQKEGMKDRDEFLAVWKGLYGNCDPAQRVWVLDFKLVREHEYEQGDGLDSHPL